MHVSIEMVVVLLGLLGAAIAFLLLPSKSLAIAPARDPIAMDLPFPVWLESGGQVTWSNHAYDALARLHPDLPLFPDGSDRRRVDDEQGERWFRTQRMGAVGMALPADDIVRAEADLRQIVQTMAKAFAQLPIGLAVFDRDRHLHLFNPALCDLTDLAPEFLSRRPSLLSMLDAMRNRNTVPEPKDWKGWRRQIVEMERAAASGQYEETWSLPAGRTYKVTGRPHPDGALALMIEDISTETLRSHRHRADLELAQAVIDTSDEAIAVFSVSGQLVLSNSAYAALWGHDPGATLSTAGFAQMAAHWRDLCAPTTLWTQAEGFASSLDTRSDLHGKARLSDGRLLSCRFSALSGGATLAGFRVHPPRSQPRAVARSG